jgi:thiol-disulfide isomerase/thioredoxin
MSFRRRSACYGALLAFGCGLLLAAVGCSEPQTQVTAKSPSARDKRQPAQKPVNAKQARSPSLTARATAGAESADSETTVAKSQPLNLTIPSGGAKEILEFLLKLDQVSLEENTPEAIGELVRVQQKIIEGADKLLAQPDLDEKTRLTGIMLKWSASIVLVKLDDPGAEERFLALAESLISDKNPSVARMARVQLKQLDIGRTVNALIAGKAKSTDKLLQDLDVILREAGLRYEQFKLVLEVAKVLESLEKYDDAAKIYAALEQAFAKSSEPALAEAAAEVAAKAGTRLGWLGKQAEVKEMRRDGQEFDLSEYKGKVVLVDFWATWCGPCLAELPNILENYKKYHDRGFEIVGISLDSDQEKLDKFFKEHDLPWPTLWNPKIAEEIVEDPLSHPLAKKYGVDSLPHTLLLDQQGKVVSIDVGGKRLGETLAELLGEPDEEGQKDVGN